MIGELRDSAGDASTLRNLTDLFVTDATATLAKVDLALERARVAAAPGGREEDVRLIAAEIARLAHTLKGSAAQIGADILAWLCKRLEQQAKAFPPPQCQESQKSMNEQQAKADPFPGWPAVQKSTDEIRQELAAVNADFTALWV